MEQRKRRGSIRNEERRSNQEQGRRTLNMKRNAFLAIAIGGLSAGLIDLAQALVLFGTRVPFRHRRRVNRPASSPWRRCCRLCARYFPAFFHRYFSCNCLLRRVPLAEI